VTGQGQTSCENRDKGLGRLASEGIAQSESYDFHSLWHTFVSVLVKSGCNIKVAQTLARHSDPGLTLGV
jgi:site-specific recombinase XerD